MPTSGSLKTLEACELILGNSNPKFSGVTSTMLQTLAHQKKLMNVKVMGKHHVNDKNSLISFWQTIRICQSPLASGKYRIFHARRNNEMIQALILKYTFSAKMKIVFTSTAQRQHTAFTRWLITKMDAIISTCDAAASYLKEKPDIIIPHGVDTDSYQPSSNKHNDWNELQLPGEFGIGIFGRVRKQKGVHHFVNACIKLLPKHPEYTAIIVGATSKKDIAFVASLKESVTAAGLDKRIVFLGQQPFDQIPKLFKSMSLVAALSDNEGFGLTVLEAMSSGTAVLATNEGAWREIIRENIDGKVIPTNNSKKLLEAMDSLLTEPQQLTTMGESGRQRVLTQYCVKTEAAALCDFFKSLQ